MKRISYAVMSTLTALVLLFGYRTSTSSTAASSSTVAISGAAPTGTSASSSSTTTGNAASNTGSSSSSTSTSAAAPSSAAASASSTATKTITGTAAQTRYGPVQVQITVQNGKVTNVSVVEYPSNNGRDQEINSNALPILVSETLKAQSAKIDMVSGATYTSNGYLTSLQSALDQAGI
jgi:uncharacterized protein with FMN-binding domain